MGLPVAKTAFGAFYVGSQLADKGFTKYAAGQIIGAPLLGDYVNGGTYIPAYGWNTVVSGLLNFWLPMGIAHLVDKKVLSGSHKQIKSATMGLLQ